MKLYLTPTLYVDPELVVTDPPVEEILQQILGGEKVVVGSLHTALTVMARLGMSSDEVSARLLFATTGSLHSTRNLIRMDSATAGPVVPTMVGMVDE